MARPHLASASAFNVARAAAAAALALTALTTACTKGEQRAAGGDTATGTSGVAEAASAAASGAGTGSIHLEVTGGPNAGTYDVKMPDAGCSYGLAGDRAWGNQFSIDTKDPKQFSSLQLIVPEAKAAAGGTSTFQMTAGFGPLLSGGTTYDVNTTREAATKKGSGKVTVEDRGTTGRVTFEAATADGVKLKGAIDCTTVVRNG